MGVVLSAVYPAVCRFVLAIMFKLELERFTAPYLVTKPTHSSTDRLLNDVQTAPYILVTANVRAADGGQPVYPASVHAAVCRWVLRGLRKRGKDGSRGRSGVGSTSTVERRRGIH